MSKKLIYRLILFIATLVAVNFILNGLYKTFVVHNILNRAKDQQFAEYADTLKYLAMGNSHNCVNTFILENSFNYGAPGESYIQSYYKLKYILEETNKKPENVILFIDMSSFNGVLGDRLEYNSYWIKYINYFELARVKNDRKVLNKWVEGRFFSYAGNYKDIKLSFVYLVKIKELNLHNGYRPHRDFKNFTDVKNKYREAKKKVDIYLKRDSYFDPVLQYYFESILELCLENDINVILVRIPVTKEYYEEASIGIPLSDLYGKIEDSYRKFDNVSMVLDYHDLYFDHPEYFFDADHLNPRGSDLFTTRLRDDIFHSIQPQ